MKKLLLAALLAISTSVAANDDTPYKSSVEFCTGVSGLAEHVMRNRQIGVPLSKMLSVAESSEKIDSSLREPLTNFILEAYGSPQYSSEKMRERVTNEFANTVMLTCMKEMK